MSIYLRKATEYYHWSMEVSDPRVSGWLLMQSPWQPVAIVAFYLLVLYFGPMLMKNRPAFDLKSILIFYNFSLVALSTYMVVEIILSTRAIPNFNFWCQGVEYINEPNLMRHANVQWIYFFSKIVEFLETFFFILRKKDNQISFLHVYHHISMCLLWWVIVKWNAGGTSYFGAVLNSFVHVVMYTYYFLSALGPQYRKYLWWKKYLTSLQLIQFGILMVFIPIAHTVRNCTYPRWVTILFFVYNITLIFLFGKFFVHEYINKGKAAKKGN